MLSSIRRNLLPLFALFVISHQLLANVPNSYWFIQSKDTLYVPFRILGLHQSWGFYSGNLSSTNFLALQYNYPDGTYDTRPLVSAQPARPWKAVIGNSESDLLSNSNGMGTQILKYECRAHIKPVKSITLKYLDVSFFKLNQSPTSNAGRTYKDAYTVECVI